MILQAIKQANSLGASDVFLIPESVPMARVDGSVRKVGSGPVGAKEFRRWLASFLTAKDYARLSNREAIDLIYEHEPVGRFRAHIHVVDGRVSVALRRIPSRIPDLEELGLPLEVSRILDLQRGLVLIVGATGTGKSTTLAAILSRMAQSRSRHIVSIEDPIEFPLAPSGAGHGEKSWITQLEIGRDVVDFNSAFTGGLRHNPDVFVIGEIRSREAFEVALQAAESGHLVLATLHASDAAEAIHRFVGYFRADEQKRARHRLSLVLRTLVAQRLIRVATGMGRVPATEILNHNERVREILASTDRLHELVDVIEESHTTFGMRSFDQSLMDLFTAGKIGIDTALNAASRPGLFEMRVRGVTTMAEERRWAQFQGTDGNLDVVAVESAHGPSNLELDYKWKIPRRRSLGTRMLALERGRTDWALLTGATVFGLLVILLSLVTSRS